MADFSCIYYTNNGEPGKALCYISPGEPPLYLLPGCDSYGISDDGLTLAAVAYAPDGSEGKAIFLYAGGAACILPLAGSSPLGLWQATNTGGVYYQARTAGGEYFLYTGGTIQTIV